jgi:hypothetical protein
MRAKSGLRSISPHPHIKRGGYSAGPFLLE